MQTKQARSSVAALCALVCGSCLRGGTAELSEGHLRTCCRSRHSPYAEASAASPFSLSLHTVLPLPALCPPTPYPSLPVCPLPLRVSYCPFCWVASRSPLKQDFPSVTLRRIKWTIAFVNAVILPTACVTGNRIWLLLTKRSQSTETFPTASEALFWA